MASKMAPWIHNGPLSGLFRWYLGVLTCFLWWGGGGGGGISPHGHHHYHYMYYIQESYEAEKGETVVYQNDMQDWFLLEKCCPFLSSREAQWLLCQFSDHHNDYYRCSNQHQDKYLSPGTALMNMDFSIQRWFVCNPIKNPSTELLLAAELVSSATLLPLRVFLLGMQSAVLRWWCVFKTIITWCVYGVHCLCWTVESVRTDTLQFRQGMVVYNLVQTSVTMSAGTVVLLQWSCWQDHRVRSGTPLINIDFVPIGPMNRI